MDQLTFRGPQLAMLVDQHVGDRIRQRRMLLGFTQEQLAEALGISYQQIQKYETGTNRISAGRLFQIGRRLEVDVAYFFDGLDNAGRLNDEDEPATTNSTRSIIELVRSFQSVRDDGLRAAILNLVRNAASAHNTNDAATPFQTAEKTVNGNGANGFTSR